MTTQTVVIVVGFLMAVIWFGVLHQLRSTTPYIWLKKFVDEAPVRLHKFREKRKAKREARRRHIRIRKDPDWFSRDSRPRTSP